jgi:hypothetical protein
MKPAVESALVELLEEIESMADDEGWRIPLSDALSFFPLKAEDFYRFAYARRNDDGFHVPDDSLTPENFDDFLRFLEHRGWPDASSFFFRAGYALGASRRTDLLEFFYSVTVSRLQNHDVDRELLENSLAGCRDPADGFDFYCAASVDLEELIDFATDLYLDHHKIERHPFSVSRLRGMLREEVRVGTIIPEDLFRPLASVLRDRAIAWNLLDEDEPAPEFLALSKEMRAALVFMGFPQERPPGRQALKTRYRELMKKFHPDINPDGDEKSRQLNSAYSLLLSSLDSQ